MKIVNLHKEYSLENGSYIFTDFYENTNEKVALIFKTAKTGEIAEKVFATLVQSFEDNFYPPEYEIEKHLRKTVTEMHWKLAAFFHTHKTHFEISTVILLTKNNMLYFIQAGILAILHQDKDTEFLGVNIEKIYDSDYSMPRMGANDEEFQFKIYSKKLNPSSRLIILPAFSSNNLIKEYTKTQDMNRLIKKSQEQNLQPVFAFEPSHISNKKIKKRFKITTLISGRVLITIIILASFYVLLGRKLFQGWFSSSKEIINEKKNQNLNIEQIFIPDQTLKFKEKWEWVAPGKITATPYFDSENIYLICNNTITSIKQNTYKVIWSQKIANKITSIKLLRRNKLLLIDSAGNLHLIDKIKGLPIWEKENELPAGETQRLHRQIEFIDFIRDGRLEKTYYIEVKDNFLTIYSADKGERISEKQFDQKIDFISEYDYIDHCFYLTFGEKIMKVNLTIG